MLALVHDTIFLSLHLVGDELEIYAQVSCAVDRVRHDFSHRYDQIHLCIGMDANTCIGYNLGGFS